MRALSSPCDLTVRARTACRAARQVRWKCALKLPPLPSRASSTPQFGFRLVTATLCTFFCHSHVATYHQDRAIRLWNPHKGLLIKTYRGHGYEVRDVCVSEDNSKFASCGGDKQLFLWDVASGSSIRKFRGHDSTINAVSRVGPLYQLLSPRRASFPHVLLAALPAKLHPLGGSQSVGRRGGTHSRQHPGPL